jgi:hypothetical protein
MGRRMADQTVRDIAKAEGLNKNTATRILSQDEMNELIQGYRSIILTDLVPLAIKVLRENLKRGNRRTARTVLRRCGVRAVKKT